MIYFEPRKVDGVTSSQHGFIRLSVVLAAVFGLGLGASLYLNYYQHARSAQDAKLMQGQIVDLRYQVQQDHLALSGPSPSPSDSPSPSPDATPSPAPTSTPAVAGASTAATRTTTVLTYLHSKPSASSSHSTLSQGTVVTLNGGVTNGYQAVTVNGKSGYVLASRLK
jgi:hypothetical protein